MSEMDSEFLEELQTSFLQEATELITAVESSFLEIEANPNDKKELPKILRLFHSLKGSAAAVGFSPLSEFCHKSENLLVKIRDNEIELTSTVVELLIKCSDRANQAIEALLNNRSVVLEFSDLFHEISAVLRPAPVAAVPIKATVAINPERIADQLAEALIFLDENNIGQFQTILEQMDAIENFVSDGKHEELASLATLAKTIVTGVYGGSVKKDSPELTKSFEDLIQSLRAISAPQIKALFCELDDKYLYEFIPDLAEQIELVDAGLLSLDANPDDEETLAAVFRAAHTIKGSAGIIGIHEIEKLAHGLECILEMVRSKKSVFNKDISAHCMEGLSVLKQMLDAIKEGQKDLSRFNDTIELFLREKKRSDTIDVSPGTKAQKENASTQVREAIKVEADRLDRMIDFIGELVIAETMVSQSDDLNVIHSGAYIYKHLDRLNKITRGLQEIGLGLRMVPIRQTFKKMTRIVRDISKKLDKEIVFEMVGEDTEIDRTVAEKIGDPLVHMVRNAIDHGIEKNSADRVREGKPAAGRVELRAIHKGGSIWIEIKDDGRGLDKDVLVKKAIEKKIIKPEQVLSEQEIFQLIFAAGFSTAEKVTDVSGRGVGMDVVRKNIEELRGQIDIESEKGKGSLFRIRIPNTLAIIEGMVITVGRERYVMPTQSIVMSIRPNDNDVITSASDGREMINHQGEFLPLFRLAHLYNVKDAADRPSDGIVLVVEDNSRKIALLVDQILKQQQFVIKNIGEMMSGAHGVSGGTIMPDGNVGLILDVGLLIQNLILVN